MENLLTMTLDQITAFAHYLWDVHEQGYVLNNSQQCVDASKMLEEVDRVTLKRFNLTIKIY